MTSLSLSSSSASTVAAASAAATAYVRLPAKVLSSPSVRGFVSFRFSDRWPVRSRAAPSVGVKALSKLVQEKESVVSASSSAGEHEQVRRSRRTKELDHSRVFLDARSEEDLLSGIRKETEAGRLPPNVASGMEELYWNYKNAVLSSGVSRADEIVLSNMSVAFDRMLLDVEDPFTFSPYHKAIREPFDYYMFGQTYIRPLIDFKNSFVGNASIFSEMEDKLRQGHNVVLISNHQTEADPAIISLLLEAKYPYIAENIKCVAGDRVITDILCKPFSMGRNLICVYSKKHMYDDPELVEMKRRANTRSLKEMAVLLRSGSQLVWIAPSGGRDRPDSSTGEWHPAPFDSSSVDNMRRLVEHSDAPGHIYPLALLCYDIMPPPPQVAKEIGERREISFHGAGLSIGPKISDTNAAANCNNPNETKEAYSQALYNSVKEQYEVLKSAIHGRRGLEASTPTVSLSQPWSL
ncbi:PREDICTED: glycerol-3-phosphate acyltransferase, chloroplastic-like [Tarenaya hassleriana]|uniref:glycerol-3-phosphate acyltransferase, chloroplastic-like n=1 Tax=Tarenaya hassleriana TaxID=28532 RepID=UPI00053C191B|nr:PREDICTED: glycerol-3-phosphate acyltransferase, chloroplastic-like [Tarenaya hassleriana]XP_010538387.1 PREDICTED: glycerol-3-phosphate acyltransferase, chloroplastic-like [Tarenaya hassleriana]